MEKDLLVDSKQQQALLQLSLQALERAETLSKQEAILESRNKRTLWQIYSRYVKRYPRLGMNKIELVRGIMSAIELNTPGLIGPDDVK